MKALRLLFVALVVLAVPLWADRGCPAVVPTNPPPLGRVYANTFPAATKVQITGNLTARPYELVRLSATGLAPVDAVEWDVTPDGKADVEEIGDRLIFTGPPGTYTVQARTAAVIDGKIVKSRARVRVVISDGAPVAPPSPPSPERPPAPPKPPTPPSVDPRAATARLVVGKYACTIAPISPRRADGRVDFACAAHCVPGVGSKGTVTFANGRSLAVICTAYKGSFAKAKAPDLSWFTSVGTDTADLPLLTLADSVPPVGTPVWQNGYGVDTKRRVVEGTVRAILDREGMVLFNLFASMGDSGGPIIDRGTGKVVATVCCGPKGQALIYGGSCLELKALRPRVGPLPSEVAGEGAVPCCPATGMPVETLPLPLLRDGAGELLDVDLYATPVNAEDIDRNHPLVRRMRQETRVDSYAGGTVASIIGLALLELIKLWWSRRSAPPPPPPPPPAPPSVPPIVNGWAG